MNKGVNVIKFIIMRWGSALVLAGLFWSSSFSQPYPYLKLVESVSWDSSFTTEFTAEQEKEIEKICEAMNPNRTHKVMYSPNRKFKLEYDTFGVATFYDFTGKKLWEETLSFVSDISNTGKWLYATAYEGEGCGEFAVYQTQPELRPIRLIDECFDQREISSDGEFIAAAGNDLVVFRYDGEELWRRMLEPGNKMEKVSENSEYIVAASLWFEGEWKDYYTKLYFFRKNGQKVGKFIISPDQLWMRPVLRSLFISPDGELTIAAFDATLMGFETKIGSKNWQYNFPDVYWETSDVCFIPGTDLIAVSTDHFVPKEQRRYLHLMDRAGNMHSNMLVEIKDDFKYQMEGVSLKSASNGKYLIGATRYHKHLIELVNRQ